MSENDTPGPQVVEHNQAQPSPPLEAPTPAFAAHPAGQEIVPSSTRTSFTRVGHDDDRHPPTTEASTSHDPAPAPSAPTPTTEQAEVKSPETPLLSTLSPDPPPLKVESESPSLPELTMEEPVPQIPQTYLTFLLISGKRRTMSFDPETAIGRVKELVWNSWPADWQDDRPPAPSYLRVLYLGRMLQDDETLTKLKLPTYTAPQPPSSSSPSPSPPSSSAAPIPTIMHLSIRPYAPPNEGDGLKKKRRRQDDPSGDVNAPNDQMEDAGCCRCIIC